jgi:ribosomal protein L40E
MRYSDWKMISLLGLILGFLFLIGGIFAYVYYEQRWILVAYPFRDYAAPLIILGIVLLVVGYVAGERAKEEKKLAVEERPVTEMVYCSYCGTQNIKDAVYCKKCGKKIS